MIQFQLGASQSGAALYVAQDISSPVPYWFAFISYSIPAIPLQTISLDDAWNMVLQSGNAEVLPGEFVFCPQAPSSLPVFLNTLISYLNTKRGKLLISFFNWIDEPDALDMQGEGISSSLAYALASLPATGVVFVSLNQVNDRVLFRNIALDIPGQVGINLDTDKGIFTFVAPPGCPPPPNQPKITCMSLHADEGDSYMYGVSQTVTINLSGSSAFALLFTFTAQVQEGSLQNDLRTLDTGIKYFYSEGPMVLQQRYPVIGLPVSGQTQIAFKASFDPLYPLNASRSAFLFPDVNSDQTPMVLNSFLLTNFGHTITLLPDGQTAGLVFANEMAWSESLGRQVLSYYLTLSGNFNIGLTDGDATLSPKLLCGLAATESAGFLPEGNSYAGDTLVFIPGGNAYAPVFPLPTGNSTAAPTPPAQLLNNTYTTAWINVLTTITDPNQKANYYFSQPPASPLYNSSPSSSTNPAGFLSFYEPVSRDLSAVSGFSFPAAVYNTVSPDNEPDAFPENSIYLFENQILAPCRKATICSPASRTQRKASGAGLGAAAGSVLATTPQGLLATVNGDGSYQNVLLAKNKFTNQQKITTTYTLEFQNLDSTLTDALQTNQLLLIATNNTHIGVPNPVNAGDPLFVNEMSIEGWPFILNTGLNCSFGNYSNVLIFKFCPGALKDLVAHPEQWSQSADFINAGETLAVSQWLQGYFADALAKKGNVYYDNFINIISTPEWNGVLCLKTDISLTDFPQQLQGLLAGIDLSRFNGHHFGIEVSHVTSAGGLQMAAQSSMFGLIDYEDPAYEAQQQSAPGSNAPVQPPSGVTYDFKVLDLQVLFENSAIADFSSKVQITLNQLFGDKVNLSTTGSDPDYNTIVLLGTYQDHNGTPTYVFDETGDNAFLTGGNVLTEVEIVKVQFNTIVNQGQSGSMVNSRFSIWGYLHFSALAQGMDLFSFGGVTDPNEAQKGLYFSNLFIDMSFDIQTPSAKALVFDPAKIAFDIAQSSPRPGSLFSSFPLQVTNFLSISDSQTPAKLGYLTVNAPQLGVGNLGTTWNAIVFNLNVGTAGAIASDMGFSSTMLLAWSPGSKGSSLKMLTGLQLPGTGGYGTLMGIEGVIKLAIDDLEIRYVTGTQSGYLLKMTDIALKFLGIVKFPPSGTTNCYLFGNPRAGSSSESLAWYAAYVSDTVKSNSTAKALTPDPSII